jgi:hypothetical protein
VKRKRPSSLAERVQIGIAESHQDGHALAFADGGLADARMFEPQQPNGIATGPSEMASIKAIRGTKPQLSTKQPASKPPRHRGSSFAARASVHLDRPVTTLVRLDSPEIMDQHPLTLPNMKTPRNAEERRRVGCLWTARLMAHSGWHEDYQTIEAALRKEYPNGAAWFEDAAVRDELRCLCSEARDAVGAHPELAYGGLELSASPTGESRALAPKRINQN